MATYKKTKKSTSTNTSSCLTGKPNVEGQPPDLRAKLMAAYKAMEYGGGTKNSNDAKTPVYPTKAKNKAK